MCNNSLRYSKNIEIYEPAQTTWNFYCNVVCDKIQVAAKLMCRSDAISSDIYDWTPKSCGLYLNFPAVYLVRQGPGPSVLISKS